MGGKCSISSYNQQERSDATGEIASPRSVFMEELINMIQTLEKDPLHSCILMLDANAQANDETDNLYKHLNSTSLVDTFPIITDTPCDLPTYARGKKRLDYILTSSCLLSFVKRVECWAFYDINESDHRGTFLDLEDKLIDCKVELVRPAHRQIGYSSKKEVIYNLKQEINKAFLEHNIYQRSKDIFDKSTKHPVTSDDHRLVNNLDKQVTEIVLTVEKAICPRILKSEWSSVIHDQAIICKFWAIVTKGVRIQRTTTT
jgi:hypothetical protein